jgi:hypothetical protein
VSLQETLKVLGRPIETACTLIEKLLGKPFEIAGDALSDQVRMWQWQNRLRIADRAKAIMEERSVVERELRPDFLLPYIRDSGDASDESLQDAWARLLVSAIEDESNEHIAFVNILKSMNGVDVRVLRTMIELGYAEPKERAEPIADHLGLSVDRVRMSIANFEHLGFFTPTQKRLKAFATRFIRACEGSDDAFQRYLAQQNAAKKSIIMD